jgi:hypothetical protein
MEMLFMNYHVWPPTSNKEIQVLDFLISFLKRYEKRKLHNMLSLMSDLRFKNFRLVSSLINCE